MSEAVKSFFDHDCEGGDLMRRNINGNITTGKINLEERSNANDPFAKFGKNDFTAVGRILPLSGVIPSATAG
jgi:hypothetical protein